MQQGIYRPTETPKAYDDSAYDQFAGAGAEPAYLSATDHITPEIKIDVFGDKTGIGKKSFPTPPPPPSEKKHEESSHYILNYTAREILSQYINLVGSGGADQTEGEETETITLALSPEESEETSEKTNGKTEESSGGFETQTQALSPSEEEGEYTIVDSGGTSYVYQGGKLVATFDGKSKNGVTILSAHEEAEQWVQNQHYKNADLSYIYESPELASVNEDSTDAEIAQAVEAELENTFENYDDADFYYYDENGYLAADEERLKDWAEKIKRLCALLVILEMLLSFNPENRDQMLKELGREVVAKRMDTAAVIGRKVQNYLSRIAVSFAELLKKATEYNDMIYNREVEAAEAENDSCGEQTWDYISGGSNTIDQLEGQKVAAEHYLQATTALLNSIQASNRPVKKGQLGDSDIAKVEELLKKREEEIVISLPQVSYHGENNYAELDSEELDQAGKKYSGIQNLRKTYGMLQNAKAELRDIMREELTGIAGEGKRSNAEKLQEMEGKLDKQVFDTRTNLIMQKNKLHNYVHYLENEIEKAEASQVFNIIGNIFSLAAIVVSFIYPPVGLALGVLAAGIKLVGAVYADSLSEDYEPDYTPHETEEKDTATGDKLVDALNTEANREDKLLAGVDENYLDQAGDDFWELDYKKMAELQKELSNLQNLRRALLSLSKQLASLRRIMNMELKGTGGSDNSDTVSFISENEFERAQFKLELLGFMLNEVKMARNISISNDKQMGNALRQFFISLACQVGGAVLGAALGAIGEAAAEGAAAATASSAEAAGEAGAAATSVAVEAAALTIEDGFYLGWSLGGVIGGYISSLVNNITYGSYGAEYGNEDNITFLLELLKTINPNTEEARLTQLENDIYQEALSNGILKDVGDKEEGLNSAYLAKLRVKLGGIAYLKNAIASAYIASVDLRDGMRVQLTGNSWGGGGELLREINQAEAEGTLKVFDYIVQYLGQRIEVQHRAREAERAVADASVKLGISGAIAIAGMAAGFANATFFSVMTPVITLINSCYDFIVNWYRGTTGFGSLENYDSSAVARELMQEKKNASAESVARRHVPWMSQNRSAAQSLNRINQMELEVYTQVSKGLIESLGGGRWGLNPGTFSLLRHKMDGIYNLRNILAKAQAMGAELRAEILTNLNVANGRSGAAQSAFAIDRMVALSNVATLMRTVQTFVDRHNKMNAQSRAKWQAVVGAGFAALQLFLAVKSAGNSKEQKQNAQDFKEAEQKLALQQKDLETVARGGNVETEVQAPGKPIDTTNNATKPAVGDKPNTNVVESRPETRESLEAKMKATRGNMDRIADKGEDLAETGREWALYKFVAGLAEVLSVWLAGVIYDENQSDRSSKETDHQSQATTVSSGEKGWAASVSKSETETVHYALSSGEAQMDTEAMQVQIQQNDEFILGSWDMVQTSANYIKDSRRPDPYKMWPTDRKKGEEAAVPVEAQKTAPPPAPPAQTPSTAPFQPAVKNIPNTKVLLESIDRLMKQSEEVNVQIKAADAAAQETVQKADAVNQALINDPKRQPPADLKAQLVEAKRLHKEAIEVYNRAVKVLDGAKTELVKFKTTAAAQLNEIEQSISGLKQAVAEMKQKGGDPALIKALEEQIILLELKMNDIKAQVADHEKVVKAAEAKLGEAQADLKKAARQVNELERKVTEHERNDAKGAVKAIDFTPREHKRKNHYQMYQDAQEEEKQLAASARPGITVAA